MAGMDVAAIGIGLVLGLLLGGILVFVLITRKFQTETQNRDAEIQTLIGEVNKAQIELARLQERGARVEEFEAAVLQKEKVIEDLREEVAGFREERSVLDTRLAERDRAFEEQRQLLQEAQEKLREAFEALSGEALRKNNQSFLELAREALMAQQKETQGELDKRKTAIEELVKPLKESLGDVKKQVSDLEEKRAAAYASLGDQVKSLVESQGQLQKETRNLVQALRTPNQRGQWGEMQLRKVVEMAGMMDKVDFDSQVSTNTEEGKLRPDMIIRLPNERVIVVDAKTPLQAYLNALEAQEDEQKKGFLMDHARQVRRHIEQLSAKKYSDQFAEAPELVVMFVPGEPVYSAALEADSSLMEFGFERRVFVATPTTLITLLRAVAYGWRQEALAKDAKKIAEVGEELYRRLSKMSDHFSKVGKNLDSAVGAYNDMVGSMETRVLPKARELHSLQQSASLPAVEDLKPIEKQTRPTTAPEMKGLPGLEPED